MKNPDRVHLIDRSLNGVIWEVEVLPAIEDFCFMKDQVLQDMMNCDENPIFQDESKFDISEEKIKDT